MDQRTERLGAAVGLATVLVVGVPTLVIEVFGDGGLVRDPAWVWWAAYLVYLAAFAAGCEIVRRAPGWLTAPRLVVVQLVAGITVAASSPGVGWAAVLFVVTAATAAFELGTRAIAAVVTAQTLALTAVLATDDSGITSLLINVVLYAAFQMFAVVVTLGQRREAEARMELAATHAELAATTSLLAASTRSAERQRISRDLHDVMGHQLTGLALELEVASHHATGQAAEHVRRARRIAKELLRDVRDTVGELRQAPSQLEPALRRLTSDLPGLTVELVVDERVPVEDRSAVTVVRCVQEVVTNTLRHAQARHLRVEVVADERGVRLNAEDDGRGAPAVVPGNGLTGLRERLQALGGTVAFDSGDGTGGFRVAAEVPAR